MLRRQYAREGAHISRMRKSPYAILRRKPTQRKEVKMEKKRSYLLAFCGVAIAMNIVLGIITGALGIPLYMDTLGTVLTAVLAGPVPGMIVGLLSNVITGLIYSVQDIPFALVNVAVGLIVGLATKNQNYSLVKAIVLGLVLSVVCPAIGTPIGIYVYGGLNGTVSDMLVMSLVEGGKTIFQASFLRNIASNLIDKVGTCLIGWLIIKYLPAAFKANFRKAA